SPGPGDEPRRPARAVRLNGRPGDGGHATGRRSVPLPAPAAPRRRPEPQPAHRPPPSRLGSIWPARHEPDAPGWRGACARRRDAIVSSLVSDDRFEPRPRFGEVAPLLWPLAEQVDEAGGDTQATLGPRIRAGHVGPPP